jgi:hypothetical protein
MSSFSESLLDAILGYVQKHVDEGAQRIVSYEEEERADGYCETCYYEWTIFTITYLGGDGLQRVYEYYGDFAEFVRELTD